MSTYDLSKFYRNSWLYLLLFCCFSMARAQSETHFDHITTTDGLSQSDINCIYQDKQGFMWFGTHDGLNKYDGYDFTVYTPDSKKENTINSNLIYDIVGDDQGNLWIGTTGSGLNFFDRAKGTFTSYRHDPENPSSLNADHVTSLYKDSRNRLWIGTRNGLSMLDLEGKSENVKFERFNPEQETFISRYNGQSIYTIFEDSNDQLLIGGTGGAFKLTKDDKGKHYFRAINDVLGIPPVTIRAITEDRSHRLVIASDNGLYSQTEQSEKLEFLQAGGFHSVLFDDTDHLWAGSNDGLYYFENSPGTNMPQKKVLFSYEPRNGNSLSKDIVKSLYMDRTGVIWVGTNGGGLNKFDPERKQFRHIQKTLDSTSLSYDKIRAMFEDSNGTLWVGTEGGGLNMLPKDSGPEYLGFRHCTNVSRPFSIAERQVGGKKTLFIGAESAPSLQTLDITDPDNITLNDLNPVQNVQQSIFSILVDSNQNVWLGTYGGGLHRWTVGDDGAFVKDKFIQNRSQTNAISSDIIRNVLEDSKGNIWIATGNGLNKLTKAERYKKQPRFEVFKNDPKKPNSINHNYILSLYESKSGEFWVGTFGGGISKYLPETDDDPAKFVAYTEENGLPNNVIKGILEDDNGNLWLSTNNGLSRFTVAEKRFKNYDVEDGLQDKEFQELACVRRNDGQMLFGGINGFNAFYPQDIAQNTFPPETVVTNFSIFNNTINIGEEVNGRAILDQNISATREIVLKYKENNFSFEFAALHFAAPIKNHFMYMLEGFDEDWTTTSSDRRFANYTNLSPGTYTFKVKASNNDGLWDTTPSEIRIEVAPPFWLSKMAYCIYALMLIGLLWLFYRYTFIRTTEKHQLELEHLEKEKSEEMQRIKFEFFTNISHEFRTPLTLIKGPLEYLQKNESDLETKIRKEQYTLMQKNTDYLMRLVNQLLDFRKINQGKMRLVVRTGDIISFIKEVAEPFQFLAHKKGIYFKIEAPKGPLVSWFDHDALEKVINNLLSNAFKFTPDNGQIRIQISLKKYAPGHAKNKVNTGESTHFVIIKVKDNGPGIEKKKIRTIFERFYVEKENNEVNNEGIGIGLSFTKDLVELHQGSIKVKSKKDSGTRFIVALPAEKKAYEGIEGITCKHETDNDFLVRSSETESFSIDINDEIIDENLSRKRSKLPVLLVVDDNEDIRKFITQSFNKEYTIYGAENGIQGLEAAKKIVPNVILSDVIMPEMNGMEFCKAIKSEKRTSHIPVIMLTAKSSEESMMEGLHIGADDYLTKPFNIELLKVKLSNLISQRDEMRKQFNRQIAIKPSEVTVTSVDEKFLNQAIEIVEKHMMNTDFNVEMLVKEMNLSRSNIFLKLKEITGLTSSEFIRNVRLKRAVQLFDSSDLSAKEIMYMTGFNTASYFSKCFKKQFGVMPSEYVRNLKQKTKRPAYTKSI